MPPRIDLLIPLYNGREYLPALLSDIARVREHFANILFFDDASADGSADYLEENGYSVMRGKENRGQAFARNVLLHAASSDFIHFHDMDDPLHAKFFERDYPISRGFRDLHRGVLLPSTRIMLSLSLSLRP